MPRKEPGFAERLQTAAKAKQALLEKMRAAAAPGDALSAKRQAQIEAQKAREARAAERKAADRLNAERIRAERDAKEAEKARAAAEEKARKEAEKTAKARAAAELEAAQKATRDAKYAARKARQK